MTKRSGYRVLLQAFLPADVNNPASIMAAQDALVDLDAALKTGGFIATTRRQRYFQSTEVADGGAQLPLPQTATEDGGDPAAGDPDFGEVEEPAPAEQPIGHGRLSNGDPDMPSVLRRGKRAAE